MCMTRSTERPVSRFSLCCLLLVIVSCFFASLFRAVTRPKLASATTGFVSWQSSLGAIPEWHTPRHPGECPREDEADYPPRCHRWSDQIQTAGGGQNEQQCWKCQSAWWSGCPMRSHRVARQPPSTSPSVLSGTKTSVSARLLIETAKVISDDEICLHCFIYLDI